MKCYSPWSAPVHSCRSLASFRCHLCILPSYSALHPAPEGNTGQEEYRDDKLQGRKTMKGQCKGKYVSRGTFIKVQQMLENGEPTPQTFYISSSVTQLITYITLIRIVLKAHGNSLMQAIWAFRDQWHRVLTKTHSSVILFFFILPNTASKQTHIVPLSKSCFLWHWSNQVHPCVLLVCSTTNSEMISPHQALYCR